MSSEEFPTVDFDLELKTLHGESIRSEDRNFTLAEACAVGLVYEGNKSSAGKEKLKRYKLATKLIEGGQHQISDDDIERILASSEERWNPLIYGQIHEALKDGLE